MGLHTCLEEIERCGGVCLGSYLLTTGVVYLRHLADERNDITQELHQSAYTHITTGAYAEYGEDATCHKPLADTLTHLVLCQTLTLEEFLHQRLIILCSGLYERLVQFHRLVHLVGRDILNRRSTTLGLPRVFLHQQHVDHGIETGACLDRILNLYALRTVDLLHVRHHRVEIAVVAIQLVHQEDDGFLQLLRITERILGTYLRTILTVDQDHGLIGHVERSDSTTHKVVGTWTVDDVQLLVVPLNMKNG